MEFSGLYSASLPDLLYGEFNRYSHEKLEFPPEILKIAKIDANWRLKSPIIFQNIDQKRLRANHLGFPGSYNHLIRPIHW
jgi:hypothetical protein